MPVKLLDPTLDIVFKLLLLRNTELLHDMIEAVLRVSPRRGPHRELFSRVLEFHVLELDNLGLAPADRQANLERWARFLKARSPKELELLASEDAIMNTARNALERLSLDPESQRLAEERETALLAHQHLMASAREAGEAKGEAKGLRKAVRLACQLLGIELDDAKERRLAELDLERLTVLAQTLESERRWPENF